MGARADHRGLRHRARSPVGDGVRERRGGRSRRGTPSASPTSGSSAGAGTSREGQLLVDARGRTRRSVLGDLRRPGRARSGPRAAPRSTRSGSWRSGTSCSCSTRATTTTRSSASCPRRRSTPARASSASRWCCRTWPASSRPTCSRPLLEVAEPLTGRRHGRDERDDVSLKILAEHGRATTFLIADGVQPSNEGRGYVLRRMLRRVVTHARRLGTDGASCRRSSGGRSSCSATPTRSSRRTGRTSAGGELGGGALRRHPPPGDGLLEDEVGRAGGARTGSSGDAAFHLHDTFGFPIELTRELAEEAGLEVDKERFDELMEEQRERAQAVRRRRVAEEELAAVAADAGRTEFVGYEGLGDGRPRRGGPRGRRAGSTSPQEGDEVRFVLDRTPFYAEGGGQVGDHGRRSDRDRRGPRRGHAVRAGET